MKIKNWEMVEEFNDVIVNCEGDGEVGLSEYLMGMYGVEWDGEDEGIVEKFKKDMKKMFKIKVGVSLENESVFVED